MSETWMGGFYNICFLRFWMHLVTLKQLKPLWLIKASALVPFWWQVLALFCERAGYYCSKPTALKLLHVKTISRCQKSCQLLLSISQVSLISQHLISHLSVEQGMCENKSFVAKAHLICIFAIYFPILKDSSFLTMKHAMWPAAVVDKVQYHAKERERTVTTNFFFTLACSGHCSVVAWTQVTRSSAQFLHSPTVLWEPSLVSERQLARGKPHKEAACALPLASQTGYIFHLSTWK